MRTVLVKIFQMINFFIEAVTVSGKTDALDYLLRQNVHKTEKKPVFFPKMRFPFTVNFQLFKEESTLFLFHFVCAVCCLVLDSNHLRKMIPYLKVAIQVARFLQPHWLTQCLFLQTIFCDICLHVSISRWKAAWFYLNQFCFNWKAFE